MPKIVGEGTVLGVVEGDEDGQGFPDGEGLPEGGGGGVGKVILPPRS